MIHAIRVLAASAVVLLSGCAFTEARVDLSYKPENFAHPIAGAEASPVTVRVVDVRNMPGRVGMKKNGWGDETAPVISNQDVPTLVKGALETELRNRGYPVGADGAQFVCEIHDFYNNFHNGTFSGTATASVRLDVKVSDRRGNAVFDARYDGAGRKEQIQFATGDNAQVALDRALADTVAAIFNDPNLFEAIRKASAR